jgi:hypothetical protein
MESIPGLIMGQAVVEEPTASVDYEATRSELGGDLCLDDVNPVSEG